MHLTAKTPTTLTFLLGFSFSLVAGLLSMPARAADSPIQNHFSAHDESALQSIDHSDWGAFLQTYVSEAPNGVNRFNYGGVTADDRNALEAYVARLAALTPSALPRAEQLAYWINLYNALTVKVILDHYPVRSIRRIKYGRIFALGPWNHDLITIEDNALSLNDIENLILRPIFDDVRIHYAINCASLGCPNLAVEAFDAGQIDAQLERAARTFINHPRAVRLEGDRLITSSIYSWFRDDFGGSDRHVIEHLRRYADPELAAQLEGMTRIARHEYDWDLNDVDQGQISE